VDAQGRFVPTADHAIRVDVSPEARLLGLCNGDPSNHESERKTSVRMFNGLALALVQSTERADEIWVQADSPGLTGSSVILRTRRCTLRPRA
jgi:beta-galactosidase